MAYRAPIRDHMFLFDHVVGFERVAATDRYGEASRETVQAILTEAGRLCEDMLAPLQRPGDLHPARLENGVVRTPPGFADGYAALRDGGWVGMAADPAHGGMGLPAAVTSAVNEMMSSACMALQLCPLLSQGQIEALATHADETVRATYLPRLVSGEWSGTMNLTEPQAGSDLGALTARAVPNGDGSYSVTGQKIYITWGDADFLPNICHLVLARLPDAPAGTKGISMFLVPKYLPDAAGAPGAANALRVVSLEHKMGIHGSPTCVMAYEGATGWLVGPEHGGMAAMFTMMNSARLAVGAQGVGQAEMALQLALDYARDRRQGRAGGSGTIVEHPDVRRMLAEMRAEIFAARGIVLSTAVALDLARATGDAAQRARAKLLIPIAKSMGSDLGVWAAGQGIQIHGGMGYVEETGAAQIARDARIATIYEGTNGIQAMDLVARKMADGGAAALSLIDEIAAEAAVPGCEELAAPLARAAADLRAATLDLVAREDLRDRFAGAVPYLGAMARVLGGACHLRAARAGEADRAALAAFYIHRMLPDYAPRLAAARQGAEALEAVGIGALSPG